MRHNCTVIVPNIANDMFIGYDPLSRSLLLFLSLSLSPSLFQYSAFHVASSSSSSIAIDLGIRYRQRPMRTYTACVAINICDRLCSAGTDHLCVFGYVIFHTIKLRWAFSRYAAREISYDSAVVNACAVFAATWMPSVCMCARIWSVRTQWHPPNSSSPTDKRLWQTQNADSEKREKNYLIITCRKVYYIRKAIWLPNDDGHVVRVTRLTITASHHLCGFGSCYESLISHKNLKNMNTK